METRRAQLIDEMAALRQRIARLEKSEAQLRQAEEALRKSEARYRSLVEDATVGVAIIDPEGRLVYFNDALRQMIGYPEEELFGKDFIDFIHADDKERLTQQLLEAFAEPKARREVKFRAIHKKGHIVHMHSSPTILRYGDKIVGFSALITDITERKQMEEELKIKAHLLDTATDSIFAYDFDGNLVYFNESAYRSRGYTRAEMMAMNRRDLAVPEQSRLFKSRVAILMDKGEITFESIHRRKDGSVMPVEVHARTLDLDGRKLILGVVRDITERKQAEEQVKQLQEYLQLQIDRMPVALIIWDTDFHVQSWNPAAENIFGFTAEEALGKHPYALIVPKEAQARTDKIWRRLLEGDMTAYSVNENITKDGRTIICDWSNTPLKKADGTVAGILSMAQDITAHKQAEEELRKSEARLAEAQRVAHLGGWERDIKHNILYWSDEVYRIFGLKPAEFSGTFEDFLSHVHPDDRELVQKALHRALHEGKPYNIEHRIILPDGTVRFVNERGEVTRDKDGNPVRIFGTVEDITHRKKVEQQIEQAAKEWRTTFDSISDMVSIHDKDCRIIRVNKAFANALKMKPQQVIGKICYELVHGVKEPHPDCPHGKALETRKPVRNEFFNPHLGIHVDVVCSPIFNDNGELIATAHVMRDITEQKRAEEEIRKFKTISDRAGYGAVISNLEGVFLYVNESYARMHGYTPDELVGKYYSILYTEESFQYYEGVKNQFFETGTFFAEELWRRRKDGSVFPSLTTAQLIKDETGQPLYIAATAIDITEPKKAEDALRESEERYRALLEMGAQIGEAVIMLQDTEQGKARHIYISDEWARMTGYSREELVAKSYFDILHPRCFEAAMDRYERRLKGEVIPGLFELSIIRKDGTEVPVEITSAFTIYRGKPAHVTYIRDITERKQMEEQLRTTDRLASIGELASGIAHELNNPLTSIIGFSQLLLEKDIPADVKEDLNLINREAQRTAGVVKNILTFARKHAREKRLVNIDSIIEKVLELRAYQQRVNKIRVNTFFASHLPEIMADGFQLQQVFLNIIINAEHFMIEAHGQGTLNITTERADDFVRASFADDGPGIAEENMEHLFDPFFTTKEVGKGTGLGLSICHGIVTEHGGRMYAESEPGKGATFIVELPVGLEH